MATLDQSFERFADRAAPEGGAPRAGIYVPPHLRNRGGMGGEPAANDYANGASNGHSMVSNGFSKGQTGAPNGFSNGYSNGYPNGHANGDRNHSNENGSTWGGRPDKGMGGGYRGNNGGMNGGMNGYGHGGQNGYTQGGGNGYPQGGGGGGYGQGGQNGYAQGGGGGYNQGGGGYAQGGRGGGDADGGKGGKGGGVYRPPHAGNEGASFVRDVMNEFEQQASNWGNAMPALTGKEIGGNETDLTEAKVWGEGEISQPFTTFNSCQFPKPIMASIWALGFAAPTPIQAYCWPVSADGRDLIGIAKTGSGKTLAFLLPPFTKYLGSRPERGPSMLVMAPTRELAVQIQEEAERFGRRIGIQSLCVYGGAPRGPQLREMRQGRHLVVGTPGRLNDYLEGGQLNLDYCTHLVLDEADRMLDMGFEPQIRTLIQAIPESRQTMMFSATWPREVRHLASDYLRRPVHIQIGSHEATANKDIKQEVMIVRGQREKQDRLREILGNRDPAERVIIFVNTKRMCDQLSQDLRYDRMSCVAIHGDREQWERDQALHAFKTGRSPIMAATDVAARGLDIKGVNLVVNFDVASSAEDHIHRIGRTGRAGVPGLAITMLDTKEGKQAREVMETMVKVGQPIPHELEDLARSAGGRGGFSRFGKGGGKGKGGGNRRGPGGGGGGGGSRFGGGGGSKW